MSKEFLKNVIDGIRSGCYNWELYFIKIASQSNLNPYYLYKHTFRNTAYLPEYMTTLSSSISRYQIEPLESVQDYDGGNSKISCDKLSVDSDLIAQQWNDLVSSASGAPKDIIKGKYQGYILDGQPTSAEFKSIVIVKACNPTINLEKKNTKVFRHTANNELGLV